MTLPPPSLTLGVEEEYLLIDPETRDLATAPPAGFMEACKKRLNGRVTHELLQAQVEIGTGVCRSVGEVREQLTELRGTVAETARQYDMVLIAASTHPFADWRAQRNVEADRYHGLVRDMQALARRMLICGMHVHAGIEDAELRIDLMNQMRYFLPHLLALTTSSPFWQGQDTGLKAYRPTIFDNLPRSGIPEHLESWGAWREMLDLLKATGICDDPTKIWWDIRPSDRFPTLEMRVCEVCTRLEDAITVTGLYQAMLATLYRLRRNNQTWRQYRRLLVVENKWRAMRYGVRGTLADYGRRELVPFAELVEELIEITRDEAERLGCLAELERAREIVRGGTSADQQVAVYQACLDRGCDAQEAARAVVDWLVAETVHGVAVPAEVA